MTDVVDSTKLVEKLGDVEMAKLWSRHDRVARDLLLRHGGREIDKTDGFLLLFESVSEAVAYAVSYHEALEGLTPRIQARAGLHVGSMILTENSPADVARGAKPLEIDGVTKPTTARIMSVAQGGQTLLSRAAMEELGDTAWRQTSHGYWRIKGLSAPMELLEIGDERAPLSPPPDGDKVYRVIREGDLWLPVASVPHNLPRERDPFIGRLEDLAKLSQRLEDGASLVSVLGSGGCGKTRLLVRYGWTWLGNWPGGVWFCDLSDARTLDGIAAVVARAMDVPLGHGDPIEQLGNGIAGRGRCLIVLDNFEQVARFAEQTVGVWLDRAVEAQFVLTTRELVGLRGEVVLPLQPMLATEAVGLFTARATAARPSFRLTAKNRGTVDELVALLDHLPLAIELAAARVRVMPPAKLLLRMGERFRVLSSRGGRRDRQATLRAAIDWSWDLLSTAERAGLAQLSCFEGGFTLESAEAVLDVGDQWPADVVQALLDKSMVRQTSDTRFGLLMSVQEYAAAKLEESGEVGSAHQRHAEHFGERGSELEVAALSHHGGMARRKALAEDIDNNVVAAERGLSWPDAGLAVANLVAAFEVFYLQGPVRVALRLGNGLAARDDLSPAEESSVYEVLGRALWLGAQLERAAEHYERALAASPGEGDVYGRIRRHLGDCCVRRGKGGEAVAHYEAALEVHRGTQNRQLEAHATRNRGVVDLEAADYGAAVARFEAAIAMHQAVGDLYGEAAAVGNLAIAYKNSGDSGKGVELYHQALAMQRQLGNRRTEAQVLNNLGAECVEAGDHEAGKRHFLEALATYRDVGDRVSEGIALGSLGGALRRLGEVEVAKIRVLEALEIHQRAGFLYGPPHWLAELGEIAIVEGDLGAALLHAAAAVEAARAYPHVHALVLSVLIEVHLLRGELDEAALCLVEARQLDDPGQRAKVAALAALRDAKAGDVGSARAALTVARAELEQRPRGEFEGLLKRVEALVGSA